jgi:thiol-disulfide isomerase/thioredoxin
MGCSVDAVAVTECELTLARPAAAHFSDGRSWRRRERQLRSDGRPPCRQELPILENVQRKLGKDTVMVYAVSFQEPERSQHEMKKLVEDINAALKGANESPEASKPAASQ